jgi:hypothetical protein
MICHARTDSIMPGLFEPADSDYEKLRKEWAEQFVGACFGCPWDVNRAAVDALRGALLDGSEGAIQKVLTANPYLIQYVVDSSGHHGIWAFPKPMIRPRGSDGTQGLIPDYLIATRSSLVTSGMLSSSSASTCNSLPRMDAVIVGMATKLFNSAMDTPLIFKTTSIQSAAMFGSTN